MEKTVNEEIKTEEWDKHFGRMLERVEWKVESRG